MNKILDQAIDAVRSLSPGEQDEIAREIRSLALEAQGFKAVAGGYVFRVPSPWMFGRDRHYLVTEAQIGEIGEARRTKSDMTLAVLAAAIAAAVVVGLPGAWLPADFLGGQTIGHVLFCMVQGGILVLAQAQCCRWLAFRRLQPTLTRVPLATA
jgi:hypothetical protein